MIGLLRREVHHNMDLKLRTALNFGAPYTTYAILTQKSHNAELKRHEFELLIIISLARSQSKNCLLSLIFAVKLQVMIL